MTNGPHNLAADGGIRSVSDRLISVTAPALNEEESLEALCQRITAALTPITDNFEIVIVDNASTDSSRQVLQRLAQQDSRVKYVFLSRNFGHQGGLIAGMHHCRGDIIVTMDADLQHPPEVIPQLIEEWTKGFDIVGTQKRPAAYTNSVRRFCNGLFYSIVGKFTGIPLTQHQSDFRLLDRAALDALLALPERDKFLRGLSHWIGFRQTSVEFEPAIREFGRTKFRFFGLLGFAIHGVVSFTILPLRLFTLIGLIVATLAMGHAAYLIITWLSGSVGTPPGWLTLTTGVYFLGGMQLIGIGVLGEYLALTLVESRRRPSFIVAASNTPMYVGTNAETGRSPD